MTTVRRTNHWRGVAVVALLAGGVGAVLTRPFLLLGACVGVGFLCYPRLFDAPSVELTVDRRLSEPEPTVGEAVTVTVSVTNESDRRLHDLRLVDGVPPLVSVTDGSARHTAVLGPGETTQFSYELRAAHGTHEFQGLTAIGRDLSGRVEVERTLEAEVDELDCHTTVSDPPLGESGDSFPGRILTGDTGAGVEFTRTRQYQHGDDPNRIDWKQYARTGTLATVEYRQEQTVRVVVCLDARAVAYCGQESGPHAVSHGLAATQQLLDAIWGVGERAGVAAIGREFCWLAPGRGSDHEQQARQLLFTHPTVSPQPPETPTATEQVHRQLRALRKRLDRETQLVVVSPLADDLIVECLVTLATAGRPVTVISPDMTTTGTPGGRLGVVERKNRLYKLRRTPATVVDWDIQRSLARALARTPHGESR